MCRSCRIPHRQHLALGGEINILHGNVGIVLRHLLPQHSHDFVCIGCLTLQCATEQLAIPTLQEDVPLLRHLAIGGSSNTVWICAWDNLLRSYAFTPTIYRTINICIPAHHLRRSRYAIVIAARSMNCRSHVFYGVIVCVSRMRGRMAERILYECVDAKILFVILCFNRDCDASSSRVGSWRCNRKPAAEWRPFPDDLMVCLAAM
mmetsp:Transcript_5335/g.14428  ORF Transcript_5335/g.14428 Transcript_5335/m.14428 type:complete len:205 (-) Transcript_5335:110-724(-)